MNYLDLYNSGELLRRVKAAYKRLRGCNLCPHECGVSRISGETGICGAGVLPRIASANVHRGEEPPISGTRGSGTIFLSHCTLRCRFCQNYPISRLGNGRNLSTLRLAEEMLRLQRLDVHNINFVTPGHYLPQILAALWLAVPRGFRLPLVWNSSGYEKADVLQLLEGLIDIYLPDMKYSAEQPAVTFSSAPGYPEMNRLAVAEMHRQVGHLVTDEDGIGVRGLIIRHLVLPERNAGSAETLRWIAAILGTDSHIALMSQFFPAADAADVPGIHRGITHEEYDEAVDSLDELGLENGWGQELDEERKPV